MLGHQASSMGSHGRGAEGVGRQGAGLDGCNKSWAQGHQGLLKGCSCGDTGQGLGRPGAIENLLDKGAQHLLWGCAPFGPWRRPQGAFL